MALRNPKILRDLLHSYKQVTSTKTDLVHLTSSNVNDTQENATTIAGSNQTRYVLENSRSNALEIDISSKLMQDTTARQFQPALQSKFLELSTATNINSAEVKNSKSKFPSLIVNLKGTRRNYSTIPFFATSRAYVSGKSGKYEMDKCEKKPKICRKNDHCPRFHLENCEQSKGSDCANKYIGGKCEKQFAPYASYSESCAQRLEEDPSECMQCPWSKCGGVDNIKVPKRDYHTTTRHHEVPWDGHLPLPDMELSSNCDARKDPCERPKGVCEDRDKKKKDECPPKKNPCEDKPKVEKKKCSSSSTWSTAYQLWNSKELVIPNVEWLEVENEPIMLSKKFIQFPYDERLADYDYVRQRQCEEDGCKKPQKRKRIKDCPDTSKCTKCSSYSQNAPQNSYEMAKKKCPSMEECPTKEEECNKKRLGRCHSINPLITGINQQSPVVQKRRKVPGYQRRRRKCLFQNVEITENKNCKDKKDKNDDHRKGHPPPCHDKEIKDSGNCCHEPERKLPYKSERDLDHSYYPKHRKPWPNEDA